MLAGVLTVDDGTTEGREVYACADCAYVDPVGRGGVRVHRHERHGDRQAGRRKRAGDAVPDELPLDLPYPGVDVLSVEVGELLELAEAMADHRRSLDRVRAERDRWKAEAEKATRELKQIKTRLAPFFAPANETEG